VRRLEVPLQAKIPHMGWNAVHQARPHPIWDGIEDGSQFYFVHSYAPSPQKESVTIGTTDYHGIFTSAMARENVAATQFHPERSGRVGLKLLENFLGWTP
jgi:glutamine amidotransferase